MKNILTIACGCLLAVYMAKRPSLTLQTKLLLTIGTGLLLGFVTWFLQEE